MAYEICRDILGHSRAPALHPGGSITVAELSSILAAASAAAAASGQQAVPLLAGPLSVLAVANAKGDWHVLPDIITMLTADWFAPQLSSLTGSGSSKGWLPALGNALSSSLLGAVTDTLRDVTSAAVKSDAVDLMLYSCIKPDQPLKAPEVGQFAGSPTLDFLCGM
jgi:hypothetical protein